MAHFQTPGLFNNVISFLNSPELVAQDQGQLWTKPFPDFRLLSGFLHTSSLLRCTPAPSDLMAVLMTSFDLSYLLKVLAPNAIIWDLGLQYMNGLTVGGGQEIQVHPEQPLTLICSHFLCETQNKA